MPVKLVQGVNDFASNWPDAALEWHPTKNRPLTPQEVTQGSGKTVHWLCPQDHEYAMPPNERRKRGCPVCSGKKIVFGTNDLSVTDPEIYKLVDEEKNPEDLIQNLSRFSSKKIWWKCEAGHSYQRTVSNQLPASCPICQNRKIVANVNDLFTLAEEVIRQEWDFEKNSNLDPRSVSFGSDKLAWWKCRQGHGWRTKILNRTIARQGCPYCSGRKAIPGETDLLSVHPWMRDYVDWDKADAKELSSILPYSRIYLNWKCNAGHRFRSQPGTLARSGSSICPVCSGKQVLEGFNDLATSRPDLISIWDYQANAEILPQSITGRSGRKVNWVCAEGHRWKRAPSLQKSSGCPYCLNIQIWRGFNDLGSTMPHLLEEWDYDLNEGLDPTQFHKNSRDLISWKCSNGHKWKARIYSRSLSNCPGCGQHGGFRQTQEGELYFIEHRDLLSWKVGITGVDIKTKRIPQFESLGWKLVSRWKFKKGYDAARVESQFFSILRKEMEIPQHLDPESMGSIGGASETFSREMIHREAVIQLIESVILKTGAHLKT